MDTAKKMDSTEKEAFELVLKEILDEQRQINESNSNIIEGINRLSARLTSIEEKLEKLEMPAPELELGAMKGIIEKGFRDLRHHLDTNVSKNRENNWRIFLQSDAKKWVVILIVAIVFLTYLYSLLKDHAT